MGETKPGLVLAVDVGTTNLICHIFDKTGISKYGAVRKVCKKYVRRLRDSFCLRLGLRSTLSTFI